MSVKGSSGVLTVGVVFSVEGGVGALQPGLAPGMSDERREERESAMSSARRSRYRKQEVIHLELLLENSQYSGGNEQTAKREAV